MGRIQVLSEDVQNLIAAGEVVERPASAVKELVENAIDAGASEIRVDIEAGGTKQIRISDDGCGMDEDDMALAVQSHATSKLSSPDDLDHIETMGFRGEALASIAAVSKMTLESKPKGSADQEGHRLTIEGGKVAGIEKQGLAEGTSITIKDLFYNTPARQKFLRTPKTEQGHIKDMIQRLALANPEIRFHLSAEGRDIVNAFSVEDQQQRAVEILGSTLVKGSYECHEDAGGIRIYGLVGDPSLSKNGPKNIYWFVNRRPVKDRLLNHAVQEAFRSLIPRGLHPFSMLFIQMPTGEVDVNVHPTKSEVRFLNSQAIHRLVSQAVKKTLGGRSHTMDEGRGRKVAEQCPTANGPMIVPMSGGDIVEQPCGREMTTNNEQPLFTTGPFSSLRPIGQFRKSYLLCERGDGTLVIIDQHAAHERIGYEKLKEQYQTTRVERQGLLIPDVVTISAKAVGYLEEALSALGEIGWEIEHFGGDSFCIKGIPALLGNIDAKVVLEELAREIMDFGTFNSNDEKIDLLIKISACHAQIRFGDRLEMGEIQHLLREMDAFEWTDRCPHGRRAVHEISQTDLGKWFDRV